LELMRFLLSIALLACHLGTAWAAGPTLDQAEKELQALEYTKAIRTARAVLVRGGNDPKKLKRIYALLGQALAATGQGEQAKAFFSLLLALDPGFQLERDLSPKIRAPLVKAQEDWAGRPGLTAVHRPPDEAAADRQLVLRIKVVEDPMAMVKAARVTYQLPDSATRSAVKIGGAGAPELVAGIPLPALKAKPGTLRYHIDLLDQKDNIVWRAGSPDSPLRITLTGDRAAAADVAASAGTDTPATSAPAASTAWYKRWWVWAIAGAVVAGAATAVVVTTAGPDKSKVGLGWEVKP
jgi:hypothetical protein